MSEQTPVVELDEQTIDQTPEIVLDSPEPEAIEAPADGIEKTPVELGGDGLPLITELDIENAASLGFGEVEQVRTIVGMVQESLKSAEPDSEEFKNGFELLANLQRGSRESKDIKKNLFFMCSLDLVRIMREIGESEHSPLATAEEKKALLTSPMVILLQKGLDRVLSGYRLESFFDISSYKRYTSNRLARATSTINALGKIESNHSKYMSEIFRAMNLFPHAFLRSFVHLYNEAEIGKVCDLGPGLPTEHQTRQESINALVASVKEAIENHLLKKSYDKTYVKPFIEELLADEEKMAWFVTDRTLHAYLDQTARDIERLNGPLKETYNSLCDIALNDIAKEKRMEKARNTFLTDGYKPEYRDPESVVALHMTNLLPSEFFINLDVHDDLESTDKATMFRIFTSVIVPRFFDNLLAREPKKETVAEMLGHDFVSEAVFRYIAEEYVTGPKTRYALMRMLVKFRYELIGQLVAEVQAVQDEKDGFANAV